MRSRLRTMQGRDLAVGFGGLLAGVALAGLAIQAPKQKAAAPAEIAMPATKSEPGGAASDSMSAPSPIKIIGASTGSVPCEQQTWPYIERRCLTEAPPRKDEPSAQAAAPAPQIPVQSAETAPIRTEETKPIAAIAVTPEPKQTETTAVAARPDATSVPAQTETAKSEPAAERRKNRRYDDRRARQERQESTDAGQADVERDRGRGGKVVKRWRELVYDYPNGRRKRVIVDGASASSRSRPPFGSDDED